VWRSWDGEDTAIVLVPPQRPAPETVDRETVDRETVDRRVA
jgi:hypothetical protein